MKTIIHRHLFLLLIFALLSAASCYSQSTEFNLNAYTGLFRFRGPATSSYTTVYTGNANRVDLPYGRSSRFSYGAEFQGLRVTKQHIIYGVGLSYESLESHAGIDYVGLVGVAGVTYLPTIGKADLRNQFITLNPFAGYRIWRGKIKLDVLIGVDAAFCLNRTLHADAPQYPDRKEKIDGPALDLRPRLQLNARWRKWGLLAGYSRGLTNSYQYTGYEYVKQKKAFTEFWRFGVSYRVK